jgi:hypothetical protein
MRSICSLAFVALLFGTAVGCGSGETKLPGPLTDEQKKAIQEEDKRVFDEEGGNAQPKGKGKQGKK